MKIHALRSLIALGIGGLLGFAFYTYSLSDTRVLLGAGGAILLALGLVLGMGAEISPPRTAVNVRLLAFLYFFLSLGIHATFVFVPVGTATYVIVNGIVTLLFLLLVGLLRGAKQ